MRDPEAEKHQPSRSRKHSCVPFESEAHYPEGEADVAKYRAYLTTLHPQHPELFPQALGEGDTCPDRYQSRKQQGVLRRIKLKATQRVFILRPSFVMPYLIARTEEVEKALVWRQWGVPFTALAYVFGRDARCWYRAWRSFGRPTLVGTTVTPQAQRPQDVVADEKGTWLDGEEVVVPPTGGGNGVLGSRVAPAATTASGKAADGACVTEAQAVFADYQVRSACTDGFRATRPAWRQLFPPRTRVLCFLPAILKLTERCRGALRCQVLDRAWHV